MTGLTGDRRSRRALRGAAAASALTAAGLAAACGAPAQEAEVLRAAPLNVPAGDPRAAARGDTAFGLDVLDAWCRKDPSANVVLSPSSVASGLGMVYLGAKGETARTMARALHLPGGGAGSADPAGALPALRARDQALRGLNGKNVTVSTTDQVWSDKALKPDDAYLSRVATGYGAVLKQLDIRADPEGARRTINDGVERATQGKISDLLPSGAVDDDTGWVLTDATYLKARWAGEFKRSETAPERFTTAAGRTIRTPMMSRGGTYGYARARGWTAVDLPYVGGRLSMTALLPDAPRTAKPQAQARPACPAIDARAIGEITAALAPERVELEIPKVELRAKADLRPILTGLGMGSLFTAPDLTGLSPKATRLSFVVHAATLLVDEKGTEAAAATGSGVQAGSAPAPAPREVTFDRPYLLLVRDVRTGEPLFLARVADPSRS
ncbi:MULTISPECIES: serpin family protein [Actinomadura]|uniref:Serpin family protein n=1 Tax=Actinomadura yumaensis TaxID=111807 RepID=A0ABW2CN64_9ACTN|nr:serpin family protein [Actinomadura sp. J1-007]